jgi:endonuclease/exonuclease/phosphatase (EEP) superfamily protein YafD
MDRARPHRLVFVAFAATIALSLPLVAGFFGSIHPAIDSFGHFRAHLAVLMVLCALPLLAGPLRREGLMAIAFGLAALTTTIEAPPIPGLGQVHAAFTPKDPDQAVYKLLQLNLRFDNSEPERALSLIGRLRPDVITLDEVSPMWAAKLDLLSSAYPHRILCPYPNRRWGVAILSSRPFAVDQEPRCFDRGAMAVAALDLGGRVIDVAALHLAWPWPFEQAWQIQNLSQPLGTLTDTALLAGDLNATPWSAAVSEIAAAGKLTLIPSAGRTWLYRRLPDFLRFAWLPLYHAFAKGDVLVHSAQALEDVGSDHLPLLVEFSFKPAEHHEPAETATASGAVPPAPRNFRAPCVQLDATRTL